MSCREWRMWAEWSLEEERWWLPLWRRRMWTTWSNNCKSCYKQIVFCGFRVLLDPNHSFPALFEWERKMDSSLVCFHQRWDPNCFAERTNDRYSIFPCHPTFQVGSWSSFLWTRCSRLTTELSCPSSLVFLALCSWWLVSCSLESTLCKNCGELLSL